MGYDRGDSFPFDFEQNGIPFGSLSPRSYPIQCERNWKYRILSVGPNRFRSEKKAKRKFESPDDYTIYPKCAKIRIYELILKEPWKLKKKKRCPFV